MDEELGLAMASSIDTGAQASLEAVSDQQPKIRVESLDAVCRHFKMRYGRLGHNFCTEAECTNMEEMRWQ